jgi:transcriptional regulator with XRE-family HTH domain
VRDEAAELRLTFADHFRRLRNALGLSQRAIALRVGTGQRTVSAVETGSANLTLGSLVRLARAVGSDVPAMLTKEE